MKLPEHYQDGGPSVEFYDVRETGGPGSMLAGLILLAGSLYLRSIWRERR